MARQKKQLANLENGKATRFTGETAAANGKKGQKKSTEARRQIKSARQIMNSWGGKKADSPEFKKLVEKAGIGDDTGRGVLLAAMIVHGAKKGDKGLLQMAFDLMGDNKPEETPDDGFLAALNSTAVEVWDGEGNV